MFSAIKIFKILDLLVIQKLLSFGTSVSSRSRMLFSRGVWDVVGFLAWRARMGKDVNWEPEPTLQWLAVSKERFPA